MQRMNSTWVFYFIVILAISNAWSKPAKVDSLDQVKVHEIYNGGDFDDVIHILEGFMERNKSFSFSDSIFIAKHLAVVYCANAATREKGRYYIMRLLELVPSAKLIDMYVSEEVDRIFDKTKEEYFFTMKKNTGGIKNNSSDAQKHSKSASSNPPSKQATSSFNRPRNWVIAGSTLVIGAGIYLWYTNNQNKSSNSTPIIPQD